MQIERLEPRVPPRSSGSGGVHRPQRILFLSFLLLLLGCPKDNRADAPPQAAAPQPSQEDPRQARAAEAAQALGKSLKARLSQAIQDGGFPSGIDVCKTSAPEIASAVAGEHELKIGRTSFKLRNPANSPPEWAESDVTKRTEVPAFSNAADGTLRALLPIRLEGLCLTCHGESDSLSTEVKQALAEAYPADQATGFKEGDLRGWFWVEVPPE